MRGENKRHIRRKTTPNTFFDFTLSREKQRDVNIGLDLVLLNKIEEGSPSPNLLPPLKFLPPPILNSFDATFGLVSLTISNDGNDDDRDSL